jgi:hypothetical protein
MIPWSNAHREYLRQQLSFESAQAKSLAWRLGVEIELASKEANLLLTEEAIKALDLIELPSHGVPRPENPMPSHPFDDRAWNKHPWKPLRKATERKPSKTLISAVQRCVRRCLYFLFQNQLERYWLPSPKGLIYARSYLGNEVRII